MLKDSCSNWTYATKLLAQARLSDQQLKSLGSSQAVFENRPLDRRLVEYSSNQLSTRGYFKTEWDRGPERTKPDEGGQKDCYLSPISGPMYRRIVSRLGFRSIFQSALGPF